MGVRNSPDLGVVVGEVGGLRKGRDYLWSMEVPVISTYDGDLYPSYEGVVWGLGRRMRDRRIILEQEQEEVRFWGLGVEGSCEWLGREGRYGEHLGCRPVGERRPNQDFKVERRATLNLGSLSLTGPEHQSKGYVEWIRWSML